MRTSILFAHLILFAALLTSGCQQDPGALTPVTGRVTYKGAPVRGGIIVFSPDASKGENGPNAYGVIQEDGSFTLYTGDAAGAHAGWYRVAVSSPGPDMAQPGQTFTAPEITLPPDYSQPDRSKIACQVNLDQPNVFNLDLK